MSILSIHPEFLAIPESKRSESVRTDVRGVRSLGGLMEAAMDSLGTCVSAGVPCSAVFCACQEEFSAGSRKPKRVP